MGPKWSKRRGGRPFPHLFSPNGACTAQRIRLSDNQIKKIRCLIKTYEGILIASKSALFPKLSVQPSRPSHRLSANVHEAQIVSARIEIIDIGKILDRLEAPNHNANWARDNP